MTKEQKADALLCAARHWQNRSSTCCHVCENSTVHLYDPYNTFDEPWSTELLDERRLDSASVALSEVAALGFDIVDAETGQ